MARPNIENVLSLTDLQTTFDFALYIPRIPGVADSRQMSYRCTTASIPGTSIEPVQQRAHGVRIQQAGMRNYEDTFEFSIIETRDGMSRDMLIKWMNFARSWNNNGGGYKSEYAVPVELALYDTKNVVTRGIKFINAWLSNIGSVSLDQSSSSVVTYAATLTYDFYEDLVASQAAALGQ